MSKLDEMAERKLGDAKDGKDKVVTWQKAAKAISVFFQRYADTLDRNIVAASAAGSYRGWAFRRTASRIVLKNWAAANTELYGLLFKQSRKVRGLQRVVTKKPWHGEKRAGVEVGMFSGHKAWKRPPGRPPLSQTAWIEAETKRRKAQQACPKGGTPHKDRKPMPTEAPKTKYARPKTGENFRTTEKEKKAKWNPSEILKDPKHELLDWHEMLNELVKEGGKEFGEWATHEGKEKALEAWRKLVNPDNEPPKKPGHVEFVFPNYRWR